METSTYKILLENTQEGSASATVLELPDLQITAPTSQEAIAQEIRAERSDDNG
jgi:hypothetical protein